jgi:release factor glutamine methyltransferase
MSEDGATIRDVINDAIRRLRLAGVDEARQDAWLLMGHVREQDRAALLADAFEQLSPEDDRRFRDLVDRRVQREPTAQILGMKEFWSLDFRIDSNVLCPRPETETLVEAAIELLTTRGRIQDQALDILDLGTGSGCLLLALLMECPMATGLGIDVSSSALEIARLNSSSLGLASRANWLCGHWGACLAGGFDVIVSNPPYIATVAADDLAPEVREFEPEGALFAGGDGLDAYRSMAPDLRRLVMPDGIVCLEVGFGQASDVRAILADAGLETIDTRQDLAGIDRCLVLRRA